MSGRDDLIGSSSASDGRQRRLGSLLLTGRWRQMSWQMLTHVIELSVAGAHHYQQLLHALQVFATFCNARPEHIKSDV
jgi:hypothetical protein